MDQILKKSITQYAMAEEEGVLLLQKMVDFAPGDEEKQFVIDQVSDEQKHAKIFKDLQIEEAPWYTSTRKLYELAWNVVNQKHWLKCMILQAVIEELAMHSFTESWKRADAQVKEKINEVIKDEQKHLAFATNQIKKLAKGNEELIQEVYAQLIRVIKDTMPQENKKFLPILKKAYSVHKKRLSEIGVDFPLVFA